MSSEFKVLQPTGILDGVNGGQLRRAVGEILASGNKTVLIDCKEVTFMDSAGLAALVMALKKVRDVGGRLSICAINDQFKMLLELTNMGEIFEVFSSQSEFSQIISAS
jgi:anti-sigma B factor antagonist